MPQRESIQVKYRDRTVLVHTCLEADKAKELRERWPDGVVVLEQLGSTPLLTTEAGRSWLVRAVCTILKIDNWREVDRECTGRERYSPQLTPQPDLFSTPMHLEDGPAKKSLPVRARVGRIERTRAAARPAGRRAVETVERIARPELSASEQAEAAALMVELGLVDEPSLAQPASRAELEDLRATSRVKGRIETARLEARYSRRA